MRFDVDGVNSFAVNEMTAELPPVTRGLLIFGSHRPHPPGTA
ncbi:hypothetical protein [Nocardia sp. NRRL S-836]|nr:hypothetical protein [Nocardia sp. NRRL S-836]